jgi:amino acid transporter
MLIVLTIGLANSVPSKHMSNLMTLSTLLQVLSPLSIILSLLILSPSHKPAVWVFSAYVNKTGLESTALVALLGLLMAQYTLCGYDASASVSEQTKRADVAAPVGIVTAIAVSAVTGFVYILGFLFAIQVYSSYSVFTFISSPLF